MPCISSKAHVPHKGELSMQSSLYRVPMSALAEVEKVRRSAHRFSYSMEDTSSPKVEGLMLRSSRSLYRLCRNFSFWYLY